MINYGPFNLPSFAQWCAGNGIGIGGPNLTLTESRIKTNVYPLYLQYHGVVPTGPMVEAGDYRQINPATGRYYTAREILYFAIKTMNPWYMFWTKTSPYFERDVIPAVRNYMNSL